MAEMRAEDIGNQASIAWDTTKPDVTMCQLLDHSRMQACPGSRSIVGSNCSIRTFFVFSDAAARPSYSTWSKYYK